ncbi:MAG: O-antigen ligase family protein, partial [Flavobacteriales bacterium]
PTYAATYQSLAFYFLIEHGRSKNLSAIHRWLLLFSMVLALVFIALLSSKAGYLCVMLVLAFAIVEAWRKAAYVSRTIVQAIVAATIFIGTIFILPTASERVEHAVQDISTKETGQEKTNNSGTHTSSTQVRLITWSAAWSLLSEHPFGVGTGDTQHRLNTIYEVESEPYAAARSFNAHNQFLQTGAELGWFGIAALILILVATWKNAHHESTALLFVMLCALNFLFESFLEVQAGIVFFCFWVLFYSKASKTA